MRSIDDVVSIMRQRRTADAVLIQAMIENRDRYNGDVVVPLPDVSSLPATNRPGPNFFQESIDGIVRIANGSMPRVSCPVERPDEDASIAMAIRRRGALLGAWHETQLDLKLGRAYRHVAAYGTCAMIVLPDDVLGRADIQIRDPITAYPELRAQDDIRPPRDCGFLFARSALWIKEHYPQVTSEYLIQSPADGWDTLWDMVEWVDEDQIIIGIMGPRFPAYGYYDSRPYGYNATCIGRWPNKAGMVPVVAPRRVTLDRIMGQMTSMINYSDLFGRMLALQLVGTEKAIFPDMAILSRTGMPPQLVGGVWKDGRTGDVNVIIDGTAEVIGKETGPGTMPMLQLIDQHIRGTGGASPLFGGNAGQMRTGAGVEALGNYSSNPLAGEAQKVVQHMLAAVNRSWFHVMEGYYGDKKFICSLGLPGSDQMVEYTPAKDFKRKDNVVSYISPGTDVNEIAVAATQLVASEMMSRETGREIHPLISDPQQEELRVSVEKMTDATIAGFTNEIAQGQQSSAVAARATELTAGGMPAYRAIGQAIAEAAQGPGATTADDGSAPTGPDGQPMSPGLAALMASQGGGLTPKGQVTATAPPGAAVPAPNPNLTDFRHVLQGINANTSPAAV